MSNYVGAVPSSGTATGIINIPATVNLPFAVPLHFAFVTVNGATVSGISEVGTLVLMP